MIFVIIFHVIRHSILENIAKNSPLSENKLIMDMHVPKRGVRTWVRMYSPVDLHNRLYFPQ